MYPHIYGRLGRSWFLVRAIRHSSIAPHILHRQGMSKPPVHEACRFSIAPHTVRHRGWSVCLVHSACCLAIDPHTLRPLDRPSCPVRSYSFPGHNFPSCCRQQRENRSLKERGQIDTSSPDTSLLRYLPLSALSRQGYLWRRGKTHRALEQELPCSCCLPSSITVYSPGFLIIACSDPTKRVGTFLKNSSVFCFIPYDGMPGGFLIIVVGSYEIGMASLSLYCNIDIM